MKKLILASASPRRRELLSLAGLEYDICPADIDEGKIQCATPYETVKLLSEEKAKYVAAKNPGCAVLGSDTVVALDGIILGKPENEEDAARMLNMLSGKIHTVFTGVALACDNECESFVSRTDVEFYPLSRDEISAYIKSGEPMDKAGAYGIQGKGALLVKKIDGDYFTVVGLPIAECARLLSRYNIKSDII